VLKIKAAKVVFLSLPGRVKTLRNKLFLPGLMQIVDQGCNKSLMAKYLQEFKELSGS
jgi:hypothetical protein